ncbi:MAG TPA: OsmC family protein [Dokdonella sp.]|nr:OsmC family protein [Dokdonella sp.]
MGETGSDTQRAPSREGEAYAVSDDSGFRTTLDIAGHAAVADEPIARGGTDQGPSPYGMLSAALAACTAMTLHAYAKLKGLPVTGIRVLVRHEKVHQTDCERCETDAGAKVDRLERTVWIDGDVAAAARERLLQMAERCPVHRTLQAVVRIDTRAG